MSKEGVYFGIAMLMVFILLIKIMFVNNEEDVLSGQSKWVEGRLNWGGSVSQGAYGAYLRHLTSKG